MGRGTARVSGMNSSQDGGADRVGSHLQQRVPLPSRVESHTHLNRPVVGYSFVVVHSALYFPRLANCLAHKWEESVGVHVCVLCVYSFLCVFQTGQPF